VEHGVRLREKHLHLGTGGGDPFPLGLGSPEAPGAQARALLAFPNPSRPAFGGPFFPFWANPGLHRAPVSHPDPFLRPHLPFRPQCPGEKAGPSFGGFAFRGLCQRLSRSPSVFGHCTGRPHRDWAGSHGRHHGKPTVPRRIPLVSRLSFPRLLAGQTWLGSRGARLRV